VKPHKRDRWGSTAFVAYDESTTAIVELKTRLSGFRELRDALAQLAGYLVEVHAKQAILVLVSPRANSSAIVAEFKRFRSALRPELAERLHIVLHRNGTFEGRPKQISAEDWRLIEQKVETQPVQGVSLGRPDLQSEVLRVIIHEWIRCRGPMTSRWLEETVGCNYRTVVSAIKRLGRAVRRHSDRKVELSYFPKDTWMQLVAVSDRARATIRYSDRSGQPRSPESLVKRLAKLDRPDIAIGGVLGAKHCDPYLDLVGTPSLALSVHCPGDRFNLDFVRRLDPALERSQDSQAPARLTLHFLRRKEALFDRDDKGMIWADPVECLLDLHEARLEPQALEFIEFLSKRRATSSG